MAESTSPGTSGFSNESASSVEIQDFLFCSPHGKEVCEECGSDFRSDNAFTAGLDENADREGLEVEYTMNKDGAPSCKKHKSATCKNCFGFKKAIVKLEKDAKRASAKSPKKSTNLY